MKVKELIEKLQQADPDLDVVATPLRTYPNAEGGLMVIPNHATAYEIQTVAYFKSIDGSNQEHICLGYETAGGVIEIETEN